jgi:hypothetical protein
MRWWPPARIASSSMLTGEVLSLDAYYISEKIRPDGFGVWTADGLSSVPFFLEFDRATEPLGTLVDKAVRYGVLARANRRPWPVLIWLPTALRELHLHQALAEHADGLPPIATAAADHATQLGLSPAEEVWWLHRTDGRRALADLPNAGYVHSLTNPRGQ